MTARLSFQPWRLLMQAVLLVLVGAMLLVGGAAAADQGSDARARLTASAGPSASSGCSEAAGEACLACCVAHNQQASLRPPWAVTAPFAPGRAGFARYIDTVAMLTLLYRDLDPPRS